VRPKASNLEKAVSRKARKDRKVNQAVIFSAFYLMGSGPYFQKYLKFFATFAPLRD
jgi:hypothetical protein